MNESVVVDDCGGSGLPLSRSVLELNPNWIAVVTRHVVTDVSRSRVVVFERRHGAETRRRGAFHLANQLFANALRLVSKLRQGV